MGFFEKKITRKPCSRKNNPTATGERKKKYPASCSEGVKISQFEKNNPASVLYQKRKFFHAVRHENKIPAHKKPPPPPPPPQRSNCWPLTYIF